MRRRPEMRRKRSEGEERREDITSFASAKRLGCSNDGLVQLNPAVFPCTYSTMVTYSFSIFFLTIVSMSDV